MSNSIYLGQGWFFLRGEQGAVVIQVMSAEVLTPAAQVAQVTKLWIEADDWIAVLRALTGRSEAEVRTFHLGEGTR